MSSEQVRIRPNRHITDSIGGGSDFFDDTTGRTATVGSNLYWEDLPVVGMTVEQVRTQFRGMLDIAPDARAILDGQPVDESATVRVGQRLIFQRVSGEKGSVRDEVSESG